MQMLPVEVDEWTNQKASEKALRGAQKRREAGRRKRIDPTTCDREYTLAEVEFMNAMQQYKIQSGRLYPTWTEVLEVLESLGYTRE